MRSILLLLPILLFISICANAQTDSTELRMGIDKGPIATGEPLSITKKNYPKNLLRINPVIALAGQYQLFYERALTDHLSVEAGLGITSQPGVLRPRGVVGSMDESADEQPEVEYGIGPAVKLGVKFYPGYAATAPKGLYMGYEVAYRSYRYASLGFGGYDPYTGLILSTRKYNTYSNFLDYGRLTVGYNGIAESGFNSDFFCGLGVGHRELYYITRSYSSVTYEETKENNDNYTTPVFIVGFKFGFGF